MIDLNKKIIDDLANEALAQQILDAPEEYLLIDQDYDDINLEDYEQAD
jgi:hypothetical protein